MFKRLLSITALLGMVGCSDQPVIFERDGQHFAIQCVGIDGLEVVSLDTQFESYAIASSARDCKLKSQRTGDELIATNGGLTAAVDASGVVRYEYNGQPLLSERNGLDDKTQVTASFNLSHGEQIMGGGSRVLPNNLRGQSLPLYNRAHYGYGSESHQMYYSMPMVYSTNGYYLIFDNAGAGQLDIDVNGSNELVFSSKGGRASYTVIAGKTWADRLANLTEATGRQPMPPRWALGSFASRFGYRTQQQVLETTALYEQYDIGLDALVVDLYWFGPDIKGHMGNLRFDEQAFAQPKQMTTDLQDKGVNTVLITEPFVLTSSSRFEEAEKANALATAPDGTTKTFDFYFGNTALVDVFSEDGQEWFKGIYEYLDGYGVAGWWGDLGEPEVHPDDTIHATGTALDLHNAYGHRWAQLVYEQARDMHPDTRPFVMMRSGFVGSQRYGMIPWSGDVGRNWAGLAAQPQIMLSMGMQGIAYMHSDLGGFTPVEALDDELYIRWLQFGVFSPVFRPHAEESVASEPVYHSAEVRKLAKKAIDLRYRLMPYLYTAVYENHKTGMPLARPMALADDEASFAIRDQYMWGPSLLVAPVLEQGATQRQVYLPEGRWYPLDSSASITGGQTHSVNLLADQIPVFVKAGSVIAQASGYQNLSEYHLDLLQLHYYVSPTNIEVDSFVYHDDGSFDADDERVGYRVNQTAQSIRLSADQPTSWILHGVPSVREVRACDQVIGYHLDSGRLTISKTNDMCSIEVVL